MASATLILLFSHFVWYLSVMILSENPITSDQISKEEITQRGEREQWIFLLVYLNMLLDFLIVNAPKIIEKNSCI